MEPRSTRRRRSAASCVDARADGRRAAARRRRTADGRRLAPAGVARAARRAPRRAAPGRRAHAHRGRCRSPTAGSPPSTAVTLPVRQGEVLALIGPSGCGKTTLLRSLNRLTELTPTAIARRARSCSTARTSTRLEVTDAAPPREHGLPAAEPVPDERLRQRRLRAARAGLAGGRGATELRPAVEEALRARRPAATRSRTTSTIRRCGSRAASSSGSASPARSRCSPRCCCSTSRARRSTRARPRRSRS